MAEIPGDHGRRELTSDHGAFASSSEVTGQVAAPGWGGAALPVDLGEPARRVVLITFRRRWSL